MLFRRSERIAFILQKAMKKMLDRFKQDLAQAGFDYDSCDAFIDVLKTKGNGNGVVGLNFNKETKTYKQAQKISKTEADKIYRKLEKKICEQLPFDMDCCNDNGDLPF